LKTEEPDREKSVRFKMDLICENELNSNGSPGGGKFEDPDTLISYQDDDTGWTEESESPIKKPSKRVEFLLWSRKM